MSGEDFNQLSLKRSIEKVGQLYPVIVNQDGKILDGNNRSAEIKNPEKKTVETKNRYEELMVRGNAHYRRRISQEETRQLIVEMANELVKDGIPKNLVAKRLFEDLPYSEGYITELLPEAFKEKSKVDAGKTVKSYDSAQLVEHTVKTQDMPKCEACGFPSSETFPVEINSKIRQLCGRCKEDQPNRLEHYNAKFRHENGEALAVAERLKPKYMSTVKETAAYRKAQMSPQKSKMEERIVKKLRAKGYKVTTDQVVYVIPTIPDAIIELASEKMAYIYIDGVDVHTGKKKDRDDSLRKWLQLKEPASLIIPVDVEGDSSKEEDAKVAEIEESLKW